jgi:IS6 family transposase
MPITLNNAFKGRQHPGELIISCVRLYLRYPLSNEHVAGLVAERGVEVDASCIRRWVQVYAPELNKRCRPHLKPTNKSYRIDETTRATGGTSQQTTWRGPVEFFAQANRV